MRLRHLALALGLAGLGLVIALGLARTSRAEGDKEPSMVFLHITGEGPTAKAWYRGAPPAGIPVQEALDHFSDLGYHVARIAPSQQPIITNISTAPGTLSDQSTQEQFFIVFLER
ncbi:MAG: hypothetical protein ACC662_11380 [Planctomycetota bacterium]